MRERLGRTWSVRIRKSHAVAISAPPPIAYPSTTATLIKSSPRNLLKASPIATLISNPFLFVSSASEVPIISAKSKSNPEQKLRPIPVTTTATKGEEAEAKIVSRAVTESANWAIIGAEIAFL
jgi:hypothetical protein